jgi:AcrR family transcriptional regulator
MTQHRSADNRRSEIIEAASRVAMEQGLGRVTLRNVATEAKISSGLVAFYFTSMEQLQLALLDWLLDMLFVVPVPEAAAVLADGNERLLAVVEREVREAGRVRERVGLFLEFWVRGIHQVDIQERIVAALARYQAALHQLVVEAQPAFVRAEQPEVLADYTSLLVSLIHGCAIQSVVAPGSFQVDGVLRGLNQLWRTARPTE